MTAGGPAAAAEVAASASTQAPARAAASDQGGTADAAAERPIRRFRPERNMVELGIFGGFTLFSKTHDLYNPSTAPQEPLRRPTPDFGARLAYFPLSFLGVEAEFSALAGKYDPGGSAFIYGFRGHGILQLPLFRVVPFFTAGYGLMGVSSPLTWAAPASLLQILHGRLTTYVERAAPHNPGIRRHLHFFRACLYLNREPKPWSLLSEADAAQRLSELVGDRMTAALMPFGLTAFAWVEIGDHVGAGGAEQLEADLRHAEPGPQLHREPVGLDHVVGVEHQRQSPTHLVRYLACNVSHVRLR